METKLSYTLEEMTDILKAQGTPYVISDGQVLVEGKPMPLESPVIKLDRRKHKLVRQLRDKLDEYERREKDKHGFTVPEQYRYARLRYKMMILKELLHEGKVYTWAISRALVKEDGDSTQPGAFREACDMIKAHTSGNGT